MGDQVTTKELEQWTTFGNEGDSMPVSVIEEFVKPVIRLWGDQALAREEKGGTQGRGTKRARGDEENNATGARGDQQKIQESDQDGDRDGARVKRKRVSKLAKGEAFPFPLNRLERIEDIWQEWHEGWQGGRPIASVIEQYGRLYLQPGYRQYQDRLWPKQAVVEAIEKAKEMQGMEYEEGIRRMESYRQGRSVHAITLGGISAAWTRPRPGCARQEASGRLSSMSSTSWRVASPSVTRRRRRTTAQEQGAYPVPVIARVAMPNIRWYSAGRHLQQQQQQQYLQQQQKEKEEEEEEEKEEEDSEYEEEEEEEEEEDEQVVLDVS